MSFIWCRANPAMRRRWPRNSSKPILVLFVDNIAHCDVMPRAKQTGNRDEISRRRLSISDDRASLLAHASLSHIGHRCSRLRHAASNLHAAGPASTRFATLLVDQHTIQSVFLGTELSGQCDYRFKLSRQIGRRSGSCFRVIASRNQSTRQTFNNSVAL